MKKISIILALASLCALASCNKESMSEQKIDTYPTASGIKISGAYAEYTPGTKTLLDEDGRSIKWGNQHDSTEYILLTYQFTSTVDGKDSCYHVQAFDSLGHSADHKTAYFKHAPFYLSNIREIKPGHKFNALYPYCATGGNASFYPDSTKNMQITFPSVQRAVANGLPLNLDPYSSGSTKLAANGASANVMTARATMGADSTVSFAFKNVGALLKFTLRGDDDVIADLDSIKINSVGATLAGRPKGGVGDDGVYTLQGSFKTRKADVFLVKPEAGWAAATYYACVLPSEGVKTAKLSFTFIFKDGTKFTRSNPQAKTIVRNQIYNLDTISVVKKILPTNNYKLYFNGSETTHGPVAGAWSFVNGTASSANKYFSLPSDYKSGTSNDQPKFSGTGIVYSCMALRGISWYRFPDGIYKSNKDVAPYNNYDKVNAGYRIVNKTATKKCYVEFTTSSSVKSEATLYHVRRARTQTNIKVAFVGRDTLSNAVMDSTAFESPWDDYTTTKCTLKKGLKYTLKNVSTATPADSTEVALLTLIVQESN